MRDFGRSNIRSVFSKEDNEDNVATGGGDDLGLNEIGAEVAQHADDQSQKESDQMQIETAEAATDKIEEIQEMAMEAYRNGGLSEQTASILVYAVEGFAALGCLPLESRLPLANVSFENFGNSATRKEQTRKLAMEGISEVLKNAWAAIVRWWGEFTTWVSEKWNKFFGVYEKMQKAAEALAKKATDLESAKNESGDKTLSGKDSIAKRLAIGTSVQANIYESGPAAMETLTKGLNYASGLLDEQGICTVLLEIMAADDKEARKLTMPDPATTVTGSGAVTSDADLAKLGLVKKDKTKITASAVLPGNVVWYARTLEGEQTLTADDAPAPNLDGKTDEEKAKLQAEHAAAAGKNGLNEASRGALAAVAACTAGVVASDKAFKTDTVKTDVVILTPTQVADMAKKIAEVCGTMVSYRARGEKRTKAANKFKEQVTKISNRVKNAESGEEKTLNAKKTVAQAGASLVDFGSTKTATELMKIGHALMTLGNDSLAKFKK